MTAPAGFAPRSFLRSEPRSTPSAGCVGDFAAAWTEGADVHVQPIINQLRGALTNQSALTAGDEAVEGAVQQLVSSLEPALRQAAFDLAQQAAEEVSAQLPDRSVDVLLVDGDPTLRIGEAPRGERADASAEDFDARITLRLPPTLKRLIEDSASTEGDSVNAWVVDALSKRAKRHDPHRGKRVTDAFDL
jgi:hypothetical protein